MRVTPKCNMDKYLNPATQLHPNKDILGYTQYNNFIKDMLGFLKHLFLIFITLIFITVVKMIKYFIIYIAVKMTIEFGCLIFLFISVIDTMIDMLFDVVNE
jgi:hypothetical protein